jgi:hypothetical protein
MRTQLKGLTEDTTGWEEILEGVKTRYQELTGVDLAQSSLGDTTDTVETKLTAVNDILERARTLLTESLGQSEELVGNVQEANFNKGYNTE